MFSAIDGSEEGKGNDYGKPHSLRNRNNDTPPHSPVISGGRDASRHRAGCDRAVLTELRSIPDR